MNPFRHLFPVLLAAFGCAAAVPSLPAQTAPETVERLRRDQDEILRKAERLQALMQRLLQRYEREGKKEVELLRQGLEHLDRSGILRDAASVRDDLAATAFSEAVRKQREVVDHLEQLLDILLERNSVENLDQQMRTAAAQAATARELERRQRELQQRTEQTLRGEPTPDEQALLQTLQRLQGAEAEEAARNAQQAGTRRPFLEDALQRVEALLRQQRQLEQGLADEASGRNEQNRARQFDLGNLIQRARELQAQTRAQGRQAELQQAAESLAQAARGNDPQLVQQARDQLEGLVQQAPKLPGGADGPERDRQWDELRERLQKAPAGESPADRAELGRIAAAAAELAARRRQEAAARNGDDSQRLQREARELGERMRAGEPGAEPGPQPLDAAGDALQAAEGAARADDAAKAQQQVGKAITALERARAEHGARHPDAERTAAQMAADAAATAQELQNAPSADAPERAAAANLRQAEVALRDTEQALGKAHAAGTRPDAAAPAATSRSRLEQARAELQQGLAAATSDRGEELRDAAARQQQIAEATRQAAQDLQRAQQQGTITPRQGEASREQVEAAARQMAAAGEQLQQGQQASASSSQQQAADALQRAAEQLQRNRAPTEAQQQALRQQAQDQQQLAEDVVRLAQELKERENKAAQRALDEAAAAARKARAALEAGDADETREQQEQARQKLQEAAEQLEEERDRYQDLRQEELLFKMKAELTAFLERQRPITQETLAAQQEAAAAALSRPARRKLNQLGEQEQELAGRVEFLVNALAEEGNQVYQAVLRANLEDLREVARRLAGRAPDPGRFTTLLQQDVERRSQDLLDALERERQRREAERKQQQQQPKGKNKFDPRRERLVGLIAELEMLKRLQLDVGRAANEHRALVEARSDEVITDAEVALVERLSHRHAEVTKLFAAIQAAVEETMQQGPEDPLDPGQSGGGRGR